LGIFREASTRFKKLNYVRKRKFIEILASNITITPKRHIKIKLYPHIQVMIDMRSFKYKKDSRKGISFGANNREHFEHISRLIRAMDSKSAIGLVSFY
jgi:hypothetical protein